MKRCLLPLILVASCLNSGANEDNGPEPVFAPAAVENTFAGLWDSSYGRLVLAVEGIHVTGNYPGGTITGELEGTHLVFTFDEGQEVQGEGWFDLAAGAQGFHGQWRNNGAESWKAWSGERVPIGSDKRWLVILEAPWQEGLDEVDFSFGGMLRGIFSHVKGVEVRQRFFTDAENFDAYCREIALLPGDVYLCVATHAQANGLECQSGLIPTEQVAQALARAPNLKLIHFSACEVMAGDLPARILAARPLHDSCEGISGYDVSVDWMASALTEFTYFDLLLNRELSPQQAANELVKALDFADDEVQPGSAIPAAHFRFQAVGGNR